MYQTIDGKWVEGEVINRYSRTMSVLTTAGGTVVCKLQGPAEPKVNNFNLWPEKVAELKHYKRSFYGKEQVAIRVVFPDGKHEDYHAIRGCANAIGFDKSEIARLIESGNPVQVGPLKGTTFHRLTLEAL